MPTPVHVRPDIGAALARGMCWTLGLIGGAVLMSLGSGLLLGSSAAAATPATVSTATRHKSVAVSAPSGPPEPVTIPPPASTSVWDRIAECESGGNWKINTGNGYHGGLQFKPSTWRAFGGTKYASTANKATKAQQIAVAERVLAKQGWSAWPTCSRKVNARGYRGDDSRAKSEAPKSQAKPKGQPKPKARPETKTQRTGPAPSVPAPGGRTVVVRAGDTLFEIAEDNGLQGGWKELFAKNRDKIADPDLIYPGQRLTLP